MPPALELTGQKFGLLTVIRRHVINMPSGNTRWICKCQCGNTSIVSAGNLKAKSVKSCGCRQGQYKHGYAKTPEYSVWKSMRARCLNPKKQDYHLYGGRGIKICKRWNKFENFILDMGKRPTPAHTIDRINNNIGYSHSNCRWTTNKVQSSNKRNTRYITYSNIKLSVANWAEKIGMSKSTLYSRLDRGWSVKKSLTTL